ncbi:MAG: hypothetical protein AMXMBFR4_07450 [Candidatus Hydrogenedentota bacterium]
MSALPVLAGCPRDRDNTLRTVEERVSSNGLLESRLHVRFAENRIGQRVLMSRTYEGKIPGPTLRVRAGDTLRLRIKNELPPNEDGMGHKGGVRDVAAPHDFNTTNFHSHGLHVSPRGKSDNPFRAFEPGSSKWVEIAIPEDHPAGTYFYHPHHHGSVTVQMLGGMAGALIIEGDIDEVPEIAAAKERILVLQELRVNEDGETPLLDHEAFHGGTHASFPGTELLRTVNGQVNPVIKMRPGEVQRWRLVHAGVDDFLPVALDDHKLHQIAMDGITFAKRERVDSVLLAPGNRADVLVKAGEPGTYSLRKLAFNQGHGTVAEAVLARVEVSGSELDMALPSALPAPFAPISAGEVTGQRVITFSVESPPPGEMFPRFPVNGLLFDPERIDQLVTLGAVEEWILTSATGDSHPFHIHQNPFQVTEISGEPVKPVRWQDTVIVPGFSLVRIRIRFADFTGKFVHHCHILPHEDLGMMQMVKVV